MTKLDEWEIEQLAPYFGGPLAEFLATWIPRAAAKKHAEAKRIPAADFEQEMWAEALRYADKLRDYHNEGKLGVIQVTLYRTADRVIREDDRYVRALKAGEEGYTVDDEEFYTTGLLAKVLPALIASDMDVADAMQRASSGTDAAGIHIRNNDPHSGAENYQAMLMDIARAFQKLTEGQRRLLTTYYAVDQEDTSAGRWERQALASSMGLTENGLRSRAYRTLIALQKQLGGPSPWV